MSVIGPFNLPIIFISSFVVASTFLRLMSEFKLTLIGCSVWVWTAYLPSLSMDYDKEKTAVLGNQGNQTLQ